MKLNQEEIFTAYDVAVDSNDPDPVGTIARIDLTSGFDPNFNSRDKRGIGALSREEISQLSIADPTDPAESLSGVLAINQQLANELDDPDDIHLAARFGTDALEQKDSNRVRRYLSALGRKRSEWDKRITARNNKIMEEANRPPILRELDQAASRPAQSDELEMTPGRKRLREQLRKVVVDA